MKKIILIITSLLIVLLGYVSVTAQPSFPDSPEQAPLGFSLVVAAMSAALGWFALRKKKR